MKNQETLTATDSSLTARIDFTNEEAFFLGRFIWKPKYDQLVAGLKCDSLHMRNVSEINGGAHDKTGPHITLSVDCTEESLFSERVSLLRQDQQTLSNRLKAEFKAFWDVRNDWDRAFMMTLNAHGLALEGGES